MKHHVAVTAAGGIRIAYCGRTSYQVPTQYMHNEFWHLGEQQQNHLCLSCLKNINSAASWAMVRRIQERCP
jgi:hypothetical protein